VAYGRFLSGVVITSAARNLFLVGAGQIWGNSRSLTAKAVRDDNSKSRILTFKEVIGRAQGEAAGEAGQTGSKEKE
jgi:hypothetical protein